MRPFLPYARQEVDARDVRAVARVLKDHFLTTGPEVRAFEEALAARCRARYAVACSNGTAALHLACLALRLGPRDSVVTSPITFVSTANAARFVGAGVHFADIESATANMDPGSLERVLHRNHRRISAVFPVHFGGQPVDMERVAELAEKYNLWVVEDACHALGAAYRTGRGEIVSVGSCRHSDLSVFSFHPIKHITTGEGGAVTTNDPKIYHRLILLRNHGMVRSKPWSYKISELGYNYRITDFQCALGRTQLRKLDRFLTIRRRIAAVYRDELAKRPVRYMNPLEVREGVNHAYHLFVVRIRFDKAGVTREKLMRRLQEKGIGTQVHYIPLHIQPYYRRLIGRQHLPESERYYNEALSLPMHVGMSEETPRRILAYLRAILGDVQ